VTILPSSIVRFIDFGGVAATRESRSLSIATFMVEILFTMSGVFNALLYPLTRAKLFQSKEVQEPLAPAIKMGRITETSSINSTNALAVT
jgi:hypothetical protein